jgi:hypothetical protein
MGVLLDEAGEYIRDENNVPIADEAGYPSWWILDMAGNPILDEAGAPIFDESYVAPVVGGYRPRRGLLLGVY